MRHFLINLTALWAATKILAGLTYSGGLKSLATGALALMLINWAVVPLLKVMFLPLNLLTLGLFAWVVNVVALYFLTAVLPQFKLVPFHFGGVNLSGFVIPAWDLNVLQVAIVASFLVGLISHFLQWLTSK